MALARRYAMARHRLALVYFETFVVYHFGFNLDQNLLKMAFLITACTCLTIKVFWN